MTRVQLDRERGMKEKEERGERERERITNNFWFV